MAIVASGRLSSRLISPGLRALMARRAAEMGGLALGLGGLVLLVALGSYDPRDPSFDTSHLFYPSRPAKNARDHRTSPVSRVYETEMRTAIVARVGTSE